LKQSAPAQKVFLSRHKAASEDYHALARVHGRSRMISREATEVPNQLNQPQHEVRKVARSLGADGEISKETAMMGAWPNRISRLNLSRLRTQDSDA